MFGFVKKIKYFFSKESCYDREVERGNAKDGKCGGVCGGTSATDYLSEMCCDCKYFSFPRTWKQQTMSRFERVE